MPYFPRERSYSFRVFCHWLCNHSHFGNIILACIMFSSAMLAAEDPLNANSPRNQVSDRGDREMENKPIISIIISVFRYLITLTTSLQQFSLLSFCWNWFRMDLFYTRAASADRPLIYWICWLFACHLYPLFSGKNERIIAM